MSSQADREVALRLRGLKMDQEKQENNLAQYHNARKGGPRDAIQRVWRNALLIGAKTEELVFSHDWKIPKTGTE
jgi:hypothetical protein